jgi:uncharacterized protein
VRAESVLIAGVSARAAAESAARAGFGVTAIDAFADSDQHPAVRALSLPGTFTARAAAEIVRNISCDAVAYLANFENHPEAVRTLAANRTLWGNPPDVLKRARDPILVAHTLWKNGLAAPASCVEPILNRPYAKTPEPTRLTPDLTNRRWLLKPLASGGGHQVRLWHPGDAVPRGCYLQELMDGTAGSVVFAAARGRAVPLGVFRQLIGDGAFGSSGFRYCGNILAAAGDVQFGRDEAVIDAACALARRVAVEFGLVGVNGIDFVACDGIPYAVEINPRWCASMELLERAYGLTVFAIHASACDAGMLPDFDLAQARLGSRGAFGKAVVFARQDVTAGDTCAWSRRSPIDPDADIRDIPHPGAPIRAGRPVCTVCAEGPDAAACYSALVAQAKRVYADLIAWGGSRGPER